MQPPILLHYGRVSLPIPAGFFPRADLLAAKRFLGELPIVDERQHVIGGIE